MLPKSTVATARVQLSGGWVDLRGLNVDELEKVRALPGRAGNVQSIAFVTGETVEDVAAWYEGASGADVVRLLARIAELSGLDTGADFQGAEGHDAGAAPSTE